MNSTITDKLGTLQELNISGNQYHYFSLNKLAAFGAELKKLPISLKILLENILRFSRDDTEAESQVGKMVQWFESHSSTNEIGYHPSRILMQDFTGVPAVVDLAAMRDALESKGLDPEKINPRIPVDLVIDHSVMVDHFGSSNAFKENVAVEMERNKERYTFLKWGQSSFNNFRVVPPGTGICHQVNLEYLARVVWTDVINGKTVAYPDTLVGTDSHTTMINGMGVLGWGVGGIEAEAAMLGQPVSMLIPRVVGVRLEGQLPEGVTATDLVLTITHKLRKKGVVGKFVEFFGSGLLRLPLADRATIANMAPEYGATLGFFPVDKETIKYLQFTNRPDETVSLVETYTKEQGMWYSPDIPEPEYSDTVNIDMSLIEPSLAGPKRPQDKSTVSTLPRDFLEAMKTAGKDLNDATGIYIPHRDFSLTHGDVVIAAITSCTNTSNPSVMLMAGLLAKKAVEKGLKTKPWVKTSLAPGSKVVTEYLRNTGLQDSLDKLGFNLVGYGCTTCIGNSGPIDDEISEAIENGQLTVSAVLSGNRNFEGRVHSQTKANWLCSPPLVIAYALTGTTRCDLTSDPVGRTVSGENVFLKDIWPSEDEIAVVRDKISASMFEKSYSDIFEGDEIWKNLPIRESQTYDWDDTSTYIQNPPFFTGDDTKMQKTDIVDARILALLGDSVTTDHISPAGVIKLDGPAGMYLKSRNISEENFNSFGSRRGNHEVMMRGTFANIRIRNEIVPGTEGGYTLDPENGNVVSIYDAAIKYKASCTPLVVIAGKEYGTGSSRDWAAKGTRLLGIRAVIAESFERIHRSNLIGMGVLPLQFEEGTDRKTLDLTGKEKIDIQGLTNLNPGDILSMSITYNDDSKETISVLCRIDTEEELNYYLNGGILHYALKNISIF